MTLVEIEPGRWIAPDLVTEVRARPGAGYTYYVQITMLIGSVRTDPRSVPGHDTVVKNGLGQVVRAPSYAVIETAARERAAQIVELINAHRSPEAVTLVAL